MDKIKELYNKTKQWIKDHKKIIIGGAVGATAVALGAAALKKSNKEDNDKYDIDDIDYGRDCVMKFVVNDDTQEVLGEVPCTELYAREELDIFNDNK